MGIDFLPSILNIVKDGVVWVFNGLITIATSFVADLVVLLTDVLPESLTPDIASLIPYLEMANFYVPIDYAITLFVLWFSVRMSVLTVRIIIKLIPTIG